MPENRLLLAAGIKRALLIRNMTPGDLARRMGLGTSTVSRWTLADSRPSPANFYRACSILDVSPDDVAAGLPELPYAERV